MVKPLAASESNGKVRAKRLPPAGGKRGGGDGDVAKTSVARAEVMHPTPVRAQVAQKLRRLVTDGVYKPGDRMTERALCERLQASRPSVREALRQLEAEGLVDILPHRGPAVRLIGISDVLNLWEVCTALQLLIARRFALHGTERQIADLEQAIAGFGAALLTKNAAYIKSAKAMLFEALAAGAHNDVLAEYFHQVNARLSFLWSASLMFPGRPAESISELHALLGAIRNHNPDASEAAMRLHIEHSKAIATYGLKVYEDSVYRNSRRGARTSRGKSESAIQH